ncbi:MAG: alpha/beta hydrolase family protein [Hyphomicrobiaceae bacterium]
MTINDLETTRRAAIGAMVAAGAVTASGIVQTAEAQAAQKTFVLVHGAWHGGWCWRRVADLLERKGHKVYTPTLTGLCDRSHLLSKDISVGTHATDVANLVKWEGLKDIVLVGHSYAGFVATEVAERIGGSIASIVFLDAFYPKAGDSLFSMGSDFVKKLITEAQARGDLGLKPIPAAVFNVNEKDRAWVDAQCTPQPLATFSDKTSGIGGREKVAKKAYIRAKGYNSVPFDAGLAATKANPAWKTYEVPSGHDVMVDMPERLTEILLEVA